jgi:L-glyceraldehyde 3-phosphate reductase
MTARFFPQSELMREPGHYTHDVDPTYTADPDRYDGRMRYAYLGDSGLALPQLSLGFWHNFGEDRPYATMRAIARAAFDNGITVFDCANNYGPHYGEAEKSLGRLLATDFKPYRDELIITTKAGWDMWPGPYGTLGSRKYLFASLNRSLKSLGLDYVDIFYMHRPDPNTPLEESMQALADIVRQGKALYVGISNFSPAQTVEAAKLLRQMHAPFVINQIRWNIFDRANEANGILDAAAASGIGLTAYSPLQQGLLTNRYLNGIPADSRIAEDGRYLTKAALTPERLTQIRELNDLAHDRGQSLAEMAVAWLLHKGVTSVLVGASRPSQIIDDAKALENTTFSDDELAEIDRIAPLPAPEADKQYKG